MTPVRAAALAALCALIPACAHKPPPPPPAAPAAPPPDPVEGTYRGSTTRFQADKKTCPHPRLVTFIVWDNKFQYKWDNKTYIDAVINADDTVDGAVEDITLRGRREGNRIEGDVTNGICGLHFTAVKSTN